ncbi:MAG TPA: hypothetical protein VM388_03070 [Acidimicrobiales bacterium]|nr:hypothetical protein [Acidimicrobiales bacterium]
MSTFLVSFGVVLAAIVAVVHVVLNGPDQPPTIRKQSSGAEAKTSRRKERKLAAAPAPEVFTSAAPSGPTLGMSVTPALAGADSELMRLRVLPARRNSLWVRIRSGIALVVLVAILGALLALAVAGVMLGLTLLLRSATG